MLMSVVIALLLSLNLFHATGKFYLQAKVSIKNSESNVQDEDTSVCKVGYRKHEDKWFMMCEGDGSNGYTKLLKFELKTFEIPIMTTSPKEPGSTQGNEVFRFQEEVGQVSKIDILTVDGCALHCKEIDGQIIFVKVDLEMFISLWKPHKKMAKNVKGQDYAIKAYETYIKDRKLLSLGQCDQGFAMMVINPKDQIEYNRAHSLNPKMDQQSESPRPTTLGPIRVSDPVRYVSPFVFGMEILQSQSHDYTTFTKVYYY